MNLLLFISSICFVQIIWEDRFVGDGANDCLVSIDGTDCPFEMLQGSVKAWWSYKLKRSALRYEVGVCIKSGSIVWVNGAYPPGDWPDIVIFRHLLIDLLGFGERVECDDGYMGEAPESCVIPKNCIWIRQS